MASTRPAKVASARAALIGRSQELGLLTQRLAAAARGERGVILISGEPGIGKTRLLSEFAARATSDGWLVLSGRAYDTEGMPPYLPFAEAISQYLRSAADVDTGSRLVEVAREVALLVPELRERLAGAASATSLGPEADRYRLFQAASEFFLRLAATSEADGLLLCLDDLHWADRSTVLLFQHLARQLGDARLLVIATFRTEEVDPSRPLFAVLAELAREQPDQRISLARFSQEETVALVASLSGSTPNATLAETIQRQTAGNPFFVQEVVRHLQSRSGSLTSANWRPEGSGLPEGVRQVIAHRLSRLSAEARRCLESAAVLGDGFDVDVIRATSLSETAVTQALEEAARAGILREQDDALVFGHPLIRQVLYESLSLPRRQELHLRAAEAIEAVHARNLDRHTATLANHYSQAASNTDPAKLIDYATRAGDAAAAVFASDEALRLYDLAIAALERNGGPDRETVIAELQVKRGSTLAGLRRWAEERAAFEAAAAGFSGERRADVLLMLANAGLSGAPDVTSARRHAELALEAAAELGRPDLELAARALVARNDQAIGEFKSSLAFYEQLAAQRHSLASLPYHQVFLGFPLGLYYAGRPEEAIERAQEAFASAWDSREPAMIIASSSHLGLALTSSGLYKDALEAFGVVREAARNESGSAALLPVFLRGIGMSVLPHTATFDLARAQEIAEEVCGLGRSIDFMLPVISESIDLMNIATLRGELARADELAIEIEENIPLGHGAHGVLWPMRLAEARAKLAVARNDWRGAQRWSDETIKLAQTTGRPKYEALALSSRGRALVGQGRKRDGIGELRRAVEITRRVGDPALFVGAAAALLAVEDDDVTSTEARAAAEHMLANLPEEMKPGFEEAASVRLIYKLNGLKPSGTPQLRVFPDGLTGREAEVLRLLAAGRSSREIGDELVLSVRTVERHIANIYLKTETHGRAQITAYAMRHGLV
jgi:DNA-binding NarL/FixJ family response regulator